MNYQRLLVAAWVCCSSAAWAAEELVTLEDVVVTATGSEKERFDTALPINLIESRDMEERIVVSAADLLRFEPGVDAVATGTGSVHPMIRGLSGERVLVLVDGIRLSEQRPGGNHAFSLDPAQVERVEVVRGPASVLYGSDAIGGVVNFITKRTDKETSEESTGEPRVSGEVTLQGQDNGEGWKTSTHVTCSEGRASTYAGGSFTDSNDLENRDGTVENSFYEGYTLWGGGSYAGDGWKAYMDYSFMEADIGVPGESAFAEDYFKDERHQRLALGVEAEEVTPTLEKVGIDFGWQRHNRNRYRRKTSGLPAAVLGDMEVNIQVDIDTFTFKPQAVLVPNDTHRITLGLDTFYEVASSSRTMSDTASSWVNPGFSGVPVIPDSTRIGVGAFVQDEMALGDRWVVTPGLRADWIEASTDGATGHMISSSESSSSSAISGNLGLLYKATNEVNLYANAGRAFRAPTLLELYFYGPHDVANDIGDPDLDSETSWNFDLGVKTRFDRLQTMTAIFYNSIDDYIAKELQTSGDYEYKNYADVTIYGAEAGIDYDWGAGFSSYLTGSYVLGEKSDSNEDLPSIPPFKARYGIRYDLEVRNTGLWAELSGTTALAQHDAAASETETDGYTVGDLRMGVDLDDSWSFVFAVENMADVVYEDHLSPAWQDSGLSDQPGRCIKLMAKTRF